MKRKILPIVGIVLGLGVMAFGLWGCNGSIGVDVPSSQQTKDVAKNVQDLGATVTAIGATTGNPLVLLGGALLTSLSTYILARKNTKAAIQAHDDAPFTAADVASIEAAKPKA